MSENSTQSFVKGRELNPLVKIEHNKDFIVALVDNGLDGMQVRKILADRHLSARNIRIIQHDKNDLEYARRWAANLLQSKWLLPEEKDDVRKIRARLDEWHERTEHLDKNVWEDLCKGGGIDPKLTMNYRIGKVICDLFNLIYEYIPGAVDDKGDLLFTQRNIHSLIAELLNNKKAEGGRHYEFLPVFTERKVKELYDNYFQKKS